MNCNNHSDMRSIVLLINHRERTIFIRTIMAAIVDDKLCTIYLIHEEPVQLFLPAAALMDMLPKNEFVMVSHSCLVSLQYVQNIRDDKVFLTDTRSFPISRRKKPLVLQAFQEYLTSNVHTSDLRMWKLDLAAEFACMDRSPWPFCIFEIIHDPSSPAQYPVFRYANEAMAALVKIPLYQLIHSKPYILFGENEPACLPVLLRIGLFGGREHFAFKLQPGLNIHACCYQPHYGFCACMMLEEPV